VKRAARLLVSLAVLGAACSSNTATTTAAGTTFTAEPGTSVPAGLAAWPREGTGMEDPPVLGLSYYCTGMCTYSTPPGFARVLVYGDGTIVTTEVGREFDEPRSVSLRLYHRPPAGLDGLAAAAQTAGLADGGEAEAGNPSWCADCAHTVFTSRLGGRLTRVSAPCMCTTSAALEGDTAGWRATLRSLEGLLEHLIPAGDGEPLEPAAFVLFVGLATDQPARVEAQGIDLTDFAELPDGSLCGVVPASNPLGAEVTAGSLFGTLVRFGDEVRYVDARPAYPHEHTCADIDF
jgi:hypothetical protein